MKPNCSIPLFLATFTFASTTWAAVKPNPLFSDGAVLQRGLAAPIWGTADAGEKVRVQFDGQAAEATASKDGKWMIRLKPHTAGGPFELTMAGASNTITAKNVMVGEVWICSGQSNMAFGFRGAANEATEKLKANYPKLRMFHVANKVALEPQTEAIGTWTVCSPETVDGFSAVGYFFGRDVLKATGVPVGMIHTSWGGTPAQSWTSVGGLQKDAELDHYVKEVQKLIANYPQAAAKFPQEQAAYQVVSAQWEKEFGKEFNPKLAAWQKEKRQALAEGKPVPPEPRPAKPKPVAPVAPEGGPHTPTSLYNGMIAPLLPYGIKGAIWYQGESNAGQWREYRTLFPRMIADWREKWGLGDFPFFFVQIAPYNGQPPEIRESQFLTLQKSANTAMAVTTDVGEAADIHPKKKEPVGARLALAARTLVYGEKLEYSGPLFESMKIDKGQAVLQFKHVGGGLAAADGELRGFTVAGADKRFVPAKAEIRGDTVVVSSAEVAAPVAVRYGWANVPDVNLCNKEGLPASPFRTDVE